MTPVFPPPPTQLAAGSALVGALMGLWRSRPADRRERPGQRVPRRGTEDEPEP